MYPLLEHFGFFVVRGTLEPFSIDCISVEVDQTRELCFCWRTVRREDFYKRTLLKEQVWNFLSGVFNGLTSEGGPAGRDALWECGERSDWARRPEG